MNKPKKPTLAKPIFSKRSGAPKLQEAVERGDDGVVIGVIEAYLEERVDEAWTRWMMTILGFGTSFSSFSAGRVFAGLEAKGYFEGGLGYGISTSIRQ